MNTTEKNKLVLGIAIDGSHITLGLTDIENRVILQDSCRRISINSWGNLESIIDSWAHTIEQAFLSFGTTQKHLAIAIPGPFDYHNGISFMNGNKKFDALYGYNVKELLAVKLNIEPCNIRMINDAVAFLQGESLIGASERYENCLGITLGKGLGSAYGKDGNIADSNLWKAPFKDGIAEDYISERWFVKRYFELTGINILDVIALGNIYHESITARSVFREFAENLALFIRGTTAQYDPDVVVVGGTLAKLSGFFMPGVIKALHVSGYHVPVKQSKLGDNGTVIGAASCWIEQVSVFS